MPSTYSNLKVQLMATGENTSTWGDVTNVNLGTALEEAIVGSADVTFSSGNVTLTLTDSNATQTARNMRLRCTGTTGGSTRNLVVPSIEKPYIVQNDCADSILVKTAAGTGITVPAGKTMWVYSDGTNVADVVTYLTSLTTPALTATNVTATNVAATNVTATNNITINGANVAVGFQTTGQQVVSTSTALGANNLGTNILASVGGITLTLPTVAAAGKVVSISNISGSDVNLSYTGSTGTDGPTTIAAQTSLMLISDGNTPPYWRAFFVSGGFDGGTVYQTGYKGLPQNQQTTGYTLALSDQGKHIFATAASFTITIPTNASVAFPIGAALTIFCGDATKTLAPASGVSLLQAGTSSTGSRTLGINSLVTLVKLQTNTWVVSGAGLS